MLEEVKKSAEQYQISTNAGCEPDCSVARNGFVPMAVEWFFKFEQDRKVFYQVPVVDRIIKGMERKQEEEEEEDKKGQQQTGPLSRVAPTDTRRPDYVASLCYFVAFNTWLANAMQKLVAGSVSTMPCRPNLDFEDQRHEMTIVY